MVNTKLNGSLKWIVSTFISLIVIVGSVIAGYYISKAQDRDSTEQCIDKKIKDNDSLDASNFYSKEKGVALETKLDGLEEKVDETNSTLKDVEVFQRENREFLHENRELLVEIKTMLKQQSNNNP